MERELELSDGSRMLLRPYRADDVEALHAAVIASLPELLPWMFWCHPGYSIDESRTWLAGRADEWAQGASYDFAMIDVARGELIGGCGLNSVNELHRSANLGYWVRTRSARRGAATAAARALADFGFGELDLLRLEIVVATGNLASQRVAEKAGAVREGVLRNRLMVRGQLQDAVMFSLIPDDARERGGSACGA